MQMEQRMDNFAKSFYVNCMSSEQTSLSPPLSLSLARETYNYAYFVNSKTTLFGIYTVIFK